ncbi:unnamed protein product [Calypogeia fissa]
MIPPEVENRWYEALFEEECVVVKELLKEHGELLKVGWKSNPSLEVEGSPDNHWKLRIKREWKGRTALHVGVRRGDVELVQQVLTLCDIADVGLLASRTAAVARERLSKETTANKSREGDIDDWGTEIHQHIGCDVCGMHPILGPAFKSHSKDNYDLCLKCFRACNAEQKEDYGRRCRLAGRTRRKPDHLPNPTSDFTQKNSSSPDDAVDTRDSLGESSSAISTPKVLHESSRMSLPTDDREDVEAPQAQSSQRQSDRAEMKGKDINMPGSSHYAVHQATGESSEALDKYKASITNLLRTRSGQVTRRESTAGGLDYLVSEPELNDLLLSKDGEYKLDALAMATLHGNVDIVALLVYALGECIEPPYDIGKTEYISLQAVIGKDSAQRIKLTKVTKAVIDHFRTEEPYFMAACEEEYRKHRDFNFLLFEEYLFHFSMTSRFEEEFHNLHRDHFWDKFWAELKLADQDNIDEERPVGQGKAYTQKKPDEQDEAHEQQHHEELWRFLLKLQDGQGRTQMHVCVDEGTQESHNSMLDSNSSVPLRESAKCATTAVDRSGKLPLHRASAMGQQYVGRYFGFFASRRSLSPLLHKTCPTSEALEVRGVSSFRLGALSEANGFRPGNYYGSTPLQLTIIHDNLDNCADVAWGMRSEMDNVDPEATSMLYDYDDIPGRESTTMDILQLACFVGIDIMCISSMLDMERFREQFKKRPSFNDKEQPHKEQPWPTLHLAATYGNYQTLKYLIDNSFDPFVEDKDGNTALHCVMRDGILDGEKKSIKFRTHLLDYVSCKQLLMKDQRGMVDKRVDDTFLADRKGCVDLLLQAGCDIFKSNRDKQVPYPEGRLSSSPEFLSWWYSKQAKEFEAIQNSLYNAANAISITATLVAATSFVGPLQPPRSYTEDHQVEYENGWVATFVFCNTLSFYLAIVALIFSLIPALPVPQQAMFDELRRTRNMVTVAVGAVFLSIVSILIAFASSSIAVVTPKLESARGQNLTIISLSIGGFLILAAFFFFIIRMLGICFPKSSRIRHLYIKTSF